MSADAAAVLAPGATTAEAELGGGLLRRITSNFYLRAVLKAFFTIFFVASLSFFLFRLMPGSPMEVYINDLMSQYALSYPEARDQASALFEIDLEQPIYLQYLGYLGHLAQGSMGNSMLSKATPVTALMIKYLPWTLFSVGTGLILSFSVGIGLGMLMAYRRESGLDHVLSAFASISHSVPQFLLGIMLIVILGIQLGLLPIAAMRGSMSPGQTPNLSLTFVLDALFHAAPLILTYFISTIGVWMLTMKSSTVAALGEDYVTVARARGLPDSRITTAYVGRNALLPLFTQLTIAAGFIVGGAAVIERVFVYQGIGLTLLSSIDQRDYTVMQGVFLTITASVVFANLVADLVYGRLDPRIRLAGDGN
jgi:peptide/nickel transport system permease protein